MWLNVQLSGGGTCLLLACDGRVDDEIRVVIEAGCRQINIDQFGRRANRKCQRSGLEKPYSVSLCQNAIETERESPKGFPWLTSSLQSRQPSNKRKGLLFWSVNEGKRNLSKGEYRGGLVSSSQISSWGHSLLYVNGGTVLTASY